MRVAFNRAKAEEPLYFLFVEQQTAASFRVMLLMAGAGVWLNIRVVEINLGIFDTRESARNIRKPGADRFDLRAPQFHTRFEALEDVKIS